MSEIPANVIESVSCLLRPYGVDFQALLSKSEKTVGAKYITAKQASIYCGLSAKTIRDKALLGEIKSIKIGNSDKSRVLIVKQDLEKWLEGFSSYKQNQ